jgi:hypothetical protein
MPSLKIYKDAPLFTDGIELSATELNILTANVEAIKGSIHSGSPVHQINRVLLAINNTLFWRGGFQYRTGLTTARLLIYTKQVSGQGNHDVVVYFNGVEVDRYDAAITTLNVGGTQTRNITISSLGYDDFDIITVEVYIMNRGGGSHDAARGTQYVYDAYVFPISSIPILSTWPGVPTFGAVTASRLNQLSNAADYLANRLSIIPNPVHCTYIDWMGTNNPTYVKFAFFRARFSNENNRLKTSIYFMCRETEAYIRVVIGSVTTSYGPYVNGQNVTIDVDIDAIAAGLSYNTDYLGYVLEDVTISAGERSDGSFIFDRINVSEVYTYSSNPTGIGSLAPFTMLESVVYSTLKTRLQAIADQLDECNTILENFDEVYDRAQMVRARYGWSTSQNEYWETTFVPRIKRRGDVIWVKGKGLKICYGPVTVKIKTDSKPNDIWEYSFLYEKDLIGGDTVDQNYFYLDQFEGLYPGMEYFIMGKDVIYVAEHLRLI